MDGSELPVCVIHLNIPGPKAAASPATRASFSSCVKLVP